MNNRRPTGGRRPDRSHGVKPYGKPPPRPTGIDKSTTGSPQQRHLLESTPSCANFIERWPEIAGDSTREPAPLKRSASDAFRMLIAVHRPRYRGRTERAAAIPGWNVISLLNKQDAVGQVEKGHTPPDIVVLSSDFGRQKSFGIFRAIQAHRARGMKIIGLVESCVPDEFGNNPAELCDICLAPPYKTADLNALFRAMYQEIRGEPAPAADHRASDVEADSEDD